MHQPEETISELVQERAGEYFEQRPVEEQQKKLEEDRRRFEWEKKEFYFKKEMEEKRLAEESHLFQMKWKILEGELQKLAREKQEIAMEREQYEREASRYRSYTVLGNGFEAEIFFSGVSNELALKKRYKELIKIYHPDNLAGDTVTLQIINKTYDTLKKQFTA
ncbi:MAG: J domain-containing protein [Lachnospiraceae bacterium]|nr:J domain-containing protein [Lachnospiraceae bacterium]